MKRPRPAKKPARAAGSPPPPVKSKAVRPESPPVLTPTTASQADAQDVLVGIDWADGEHAYAMLDPRGKSKSGFVKQSPAAITALLDDWRRQYPGARICICLETSRGALVNILLEQVQVQLFPVNPNALANYRKAFAHGGGKNDPVDAALILQFLRLHRQCLRPLQRNQAVTRELSALCEDRRGLVEQRVKLAQQLKSLLKAYYPAIIALKPAKIYAEFIVKLLLKYPTLAEAQAAGRTKLRKWFCGAGKKEKVEERLDVLLSATPLATDDVLLRTSARRVQAICRQLESLNKTIREYDREIERLVMQHDDYRVVSSLPCGAKSQARLIAALGDDRSRFSSAEQLASATGIAPLTTQSGRQRFVSNRWACSKFLKQTFHEFAGLSLGECRWAKCYYDALLSRGKSKQMARRAVAYKWIRIIYRCWQTREAYDDARYERRLIQANSPFAKQLTA